jgi:hypothetical protein
MFFWTAAPVAIFFLRRLLVPITASGHFLYKFFVAVVERVELTVFTEKMLSA